MLCTVYRTPSVQNKWTDLFEEELSIAQTSGLEVIFMGDFNMELKVSTHNKRLNLIDLFDLTQLVNAPTRITQTSAILIDHVYTSHPENSVHCSTSSISLSDIITQSALRVFLVFADADLYCRLWIMPLRSSQDYHFAAIRLRISFRSWFDFLFYGSSTLSMSFSGRSVSPSLGRHLWAGFLSA